jgi:hypothetical protein
MAARSSATHWPAVTVLREDLGLLTGTLIDTAAALWAVLR